MSVCLSGPAAWAPTTIPVGGNAVEAKSLFDRVRRVENGIHDQLSRKRVCICRWPTPSVVRDLGVCHRKEIESREVIGRTQGRASEFVLRVGALGSQDEGGHRVA